MKVAMIMIEDFLVLFLQSVDEVHVSMLDNHDGVSHNNNNAQHQSGSQPHGIMRKLPEDAEGAMVMVAMEDSLNGPVAALIRLVDPPVFDNFLEAAIPLRFIFFLVGPDYSNVDYHEVGRAMSTLFSDDVSILLILLTTRGQLPI